MGPGLDRSSQNWVPGTAEAESQWELAWIEQPSLKAHVASKSTALKQHAAIEQHFPYLCMIGQEIKKLREIISLYISELKEGPEFMVHSPS